MEYPVCDLLLYCYIYQHCDCVRYFIFMERQDYSGRVYPVILSEQCGTFGNCFHSEYLWKCRDGSIDDHWERAAL